MNKYFLIVLFTVFSCKESINNYSLDPVFQLEAQHQSIVTISSNCRGFFLDSDLRVVTLSKCVDSDLHYIWVRKNLKDGELVKVDVSRIEVDEFDKEISYIYVLDPVTPYYFIASEQLENRAIRLFGDDYTANCSIDLSNNHYCFSRENIIGLPIVIDENGFNRAIGIHSDARDNTKKNCNTRFCAREFLRIKN